MMDKTMCMVDEVYESTTPASLYFAHLSYRVGNKFILDDVSGCAKPGLLLGILGASGAGKSTLLDIISSRAAEKSYTGSSFVDCKKMDSQTLRHISGYVMQDDALLPTLSVRETLKYAYELRVSQKKSERDGCVTSILEMLGLHKEGKEGV
jgi:ABC-type multidrug transport system ATPase subunit